MERCIFCGKKLKDSVSIRRGCGITCFKKNQPKKRKLI